MKHLKHIKQHETRQWNTLKRVINRRETSPLKLISENIVTLFCFDFVMVLDVKMYQKWSFDAEKIIVSVHAHSFLFNNQNYMQ